MGSQIKRVMIDLETLDTATTAAIVSIGAVRFSKDGVDNFDTFYRAVNWSAAKPRSISRDTLAWWLVQPAEVQAALKDERAVPLPQALVEFRDWLGADAEVWAGPANFDLSILQNAYEQFQLYTPWQFFNTRCYTTLRRMNPNIPRVASDVPHNALEDARAQAQHAAQLLEAMAPLETPSAHDASASKADGAA